MSSYVTQLILKYANKYIRGIEANLKLSLWGGDVVLNNLDLRLDVIQKELGIPLDFRLSRGFVKELRIHIPWTALTTKSIEITLTDVECVLKYDCNASSSASPDAADDLGTPAAPPGKVEAEPEVDGSSFWAQDLLVKVVSNLYVRVNNLVFIYEEEDICATLTMSSAAFMSVNANWLPQFVHLEGPWKLLRKKLLVENVKVYLGKLDRWSRQRNESELVVKDFSAEVRMATYTSLKMPSGFELCEAAVDQACGPAVTVDVICQPLHLSLDSHQMELLFRIISNKSATTKPLVVVAPKPLKPERNKSDFTVDIPSAKKEEKRTWMSWAWDMVVDDQEGTFEAERTLQAKLLPFAPPDIFVLCLHVTEISLSLANAGKVSLPKTRYESLSLTPERKSDSPGPTFSWARAPHSTPAPSQRFAVIYLEHTILSIEKLQNSPAPPALVFDIHRISCIDHTSSSQHAVFVCGTDANVRQSFSFLGANSIPIPPRKHPFLKLPFLHTAFDQETPENELSRWQQGGAAISVFRSVFPASYPASSASSSLSASSSSSSSSASASTSYRVASTISASLCSSSGSASLSQQKRTDATPHYVSTDVCVGSLAFVVDCSNGAEGNFIAELSRFLSFKHTPVPTQENVASSVPQSSLASTTDMQPLSLLKLQLTHFMGVVKVSELVNRRLTAAAREMNSVVFELLNMKINNGWSQLVEEKMVTNVDGINIQDISVRLSSVQKKLDRWSESIVVAKNSTMTNKKQVDERLLLRAIHLVLELQAPMKLADIEGNLFSSSTPVLALLSMLFGISRSAHLDHKLQRAVSVSLSLASFSTSVSPQQLAFVLSVAGVLCGLFSPTLQRAITASRLLQAGRTDKRVTDWILDVSIHRLAVSLTLSSASPSKCVLVGSLGYAEAAVEREGVRRLLFVGPFLDRDPNLALLAFSVTTTDEMLAWILSEVNLAKPPQDTKLLVASENRVVIQFASAALLWDSVWLEVSDLFIDFNSTMYESWTQKQSASAIALSSSSSPPLASGPHTSSSSSATSSAQQSVPSRFSPLELMHVLLISFCNVFEVNILCRPLYLCFPFNDQFHLRRHRLHWKYKGVTPIVIQIPNIALLLSHKHDRVSSLTQHQQQQSNSNALVSVDFFIQNLHIFSHPLQASAPQQASSLLTQFESNFVKPKLNCDIIAPWSVEMRTQWIPDASLQVDYWIGCEVLTTIKADCLTVSLTHQQTLAVALILDTLRLAHQDTTSSIRSSSFAKSQQLSAAPKPSYASAHRSPFALYAPTRPPEFFRFIPGLYHLRAAVSTAVRLYPTCSTPEAVSTSDKINFEIGCVLVEFKLDDNFGLTSALVSVSLPHLRFVPWPAPEFTHPANELFFCKGLFASLDRASVGSDGVFYQIRACVQPLTGVCNLPVILQTCQMFLDIIPPTPLLSSAAPTEFSPLRTRRSSLPVLTPSGSKVNSSKLNYELWMCLQVESVRFLFPGSGSSETCISVGMERMWLHSPLSEPNAVFLPLISELLNGVNAIAHNNCQLCDSLRARSPGSRSSRPPVIPTSQGRTLCLEGGIRQFCIHTGNWATGSQIGSIPFSNAIDVSLALRFHQPHRQPTSDLVAPVRRSSCSLYSMATTSSTTTTTSAISPLTLHLPPEPEQIPILRSHVHEDRNSFFLPPRSQSFANYLEVHVQVTPIVLRASPQSLRTLRAIVLSLLHTKRAFDSLGTQPTLAENSAHSSPRTSIVSSMDDVNASNSLRLELTVTLADVTLDICGENIMYEQQHHQQLQQQLQVVISNIFFKHNPSQNNSSALILESQGQLSVGSVEVSFLKPHRVSLFSWQQLPPNQNYVHNSNIDHETKSSHTGPPAFIFGTWTLLAMDWEILPFHLKLPFDVIQFVSEVISAALPSSSSSLAPVTTQTPREYTRTLRTTKVVLHGSKVGLYSTPPFDSAIVLHFESAFVLQSATQMECFFRHAVISDPLQVRIVGCCIRVSSLSEELHNTGGSFLLLPTTWTLECISLSKITQDIQEDLALTLMGGGTLIPFHQEMRVTVGFESVECRWETGYVRIVLEMIAQFNMLFQPSADAPVQTQASMVSSNIIGIPFLRMSLGENSGRKFFQDDFRSMSIDEQHGKRPRSAHVTFSSGEERSMCWKYPSPRSVTHVAHAALLSLEGGRSREELNCDCTLSAWDWLTGSYILVSQFSVDLHTPNTTLLETTAVAREWRLSWTPRDLKAGMPAASELGQLIRVDSAFDLVNDLSLSLTLPSLQVRLVDSCQNEQLMLLRMQHFSFDSRFWFNPGYHAPNTKALSFAAHRVRCGSFSAEMVQYRDLLRCPLLQSVTFEALIALNPQPFKAGSDVPSLEAGGWALSANTGPAHFVLGKTALCVFQHFVECILAHQKPSILVSSSSSSLRTSSSSLSPSSLGATAVSQTSSSPLPCTHYTLRNHTGMDLLFGQVGTPESKRLSSAQERPYSWYSLAPSLSAPLSAPPSMPHPFFCPEPGLVSPLQGESQHHWMRISADSLSGWSQPFVIDTLPLPPSRSIGDLRRRLTSGKRCAFRLVRVYRTQASTTPEDDTVPPFISLVSLVTVQVEQSLHTTIITFCASHAIENRLPFPLSLHFLKCPRPHLARTEPKTFRKLKYDEALSVDCVRETVETRAIKQGESTLLPVWFSRQLPSPKPISLSMEVLRIFAGLKITDDNEVEWLDVLEIPLNSADCSPLPRYELCKWANVYAWCHVSSVDAFSPRVIAFCPTLLLSQSISKTLSVHFRTSSSKDDARDELTLSPLSEVPVLRVDPRSVAELSCALRDAERTTFVASVDLGADLKLLALQSMGGAEQTTWLSVQQEDNLPTLVLTLFSMFTMTNRCGRQIFVHTEPPHRSAQQVLPRTSGEGNRIALPGKSESVPLFWPERGRHRFWIGVQCSKAGTMFWSQTFVLDKGGELTYGPPDPKTKTKSSTSNSSGSSSSKLTRQDQEFDVLTVDETQGVEVFQLVLSIERSSEGNVHVVLQPRFWIHNRSKNDLALQVCMQPHEGPVLSLSHGHVIPLEGVHIQNYDAKTPKNFRPEIRAALMGWQWGEPFTVLDDTTPCFVRLRHHSLGFDRLQAYSVIVHQKVRHLIFIDKQPPCVLINSTPLELSYWVGPFDANSKAHEGLQSSVAPGQITEVEILPLHTPVNSDGKVTSERRIEAHQLQIRLVNSILWSAPFFLLPGKHKLTVSSDHSSNAPSMTLLDLDISYWRGSLVVLIQKLVGGVHVPHTQTPAMEMLAAANFRFSLCVPLLSVAFIDEEKAVSCVVPIEPPPRSPTSVKPSLCLWPNGQEVMRFETRDLKLQVSSGPKPTPQSSVWDASCLEVRLQVGDLQLDNQLPFEEFPVVAACGRAESSFVPMEFEAQWRLPSELFFRNPYFPAFDSPDLDYVQLFVPPISLNIEDSFIFRAADLGLALAGNLGFFRESQNAQATFEEKSKLINEENSDSELKEPIQQPPTHGMVESLSDAQMLTRFGADMGIFVKSIEGRDFSFHALRISEILFRVTVHSSLAASVFLGVERMPVHLNAVSLKSTSCSPDRLVREITGGYLADVLVRTPVLLGSLSLLGNPTFLVESLGRGLQDLVNMPKDALSQGPSAFVRAMLGGVMSLLQHVTHGTLTSVSGFSNGLARNVEQLSPEDRFSLQREMMRTRPPEDLGRGLINGFSTLGQSVAGAFLGVLASPIEGAARGGAWGFVKGVSGGLIGVVTKPVTGMLDLVSQTSQGLAGSSRGDVQSRQRRAHQPRQVPLSELGLWFSALKFQGLAERYDEIYIGHLFGCDTLEYQHISLLLLTNKGLRVFNADILLFFIAWRDLSVISAPARECRISMETWYALREDMSGTEEVKEREALGIFVVENGKSKLEYLVVAHMGKALSGIVRNNSLYQGKYGRIEEKHG